MFGLWLLLGFCGLFDFGCVRFRLRCYCFTVVYGLLARGVVALFVWFGWLFCLVLLCVDCGLWFALWLSLIAYAFAFGLVVFACIVYLWC